MELNLRYFKEKLLTFRRLNGQDLGERNFLVEIFARFVLVEGDGLGVEAPVVASTLGVLVGVVDHPALLEDVGSASLRVFHRLDDPHQRDVVAHGGAARPDLDSRHAFLFRNVVVPQVRVL